MGSRMDVYHVAVESADEYDQVFVVPVVLDEILDRGEGEIIEMLGLFEVKRLHLLQCQMMAYDSQITCCTKKTKTNHRTALS